MHVNHNVNRSIRLFGQEATLRNQQAHEWVNERHEHQSWLKVCSLLPRELKSGLGNINELLIRMCQACRSMM